MEMTTVFKKDQIVWAKVHGYPWWPAIIATIESIKENEEEMFLVNFIGHNSHSYLAKEKLRDYDIYMDEFSKNKSSQLVKAISSANDIKNGIFGYEDQKKKVLIENKEKLAKLRISSNFPLRKIRKTNSSSKNLYNKSDNHSLDSKTTQESFNLDEILSTNPFQRISRSLIKELNIKTTINQPFEKKNHQKAKKLPKITKNSLKIQRKRIENAKINEEIYQSDLKVIDEDIGDIHIQEDIKKAYKEDIHIYKLSIEKYTYESKLEECLVKLNMKLNTRNKHEISNLIDYLSQLLGGYNDYEFSAEELFKSNITKIFKTMHLLLKDVKNQRIEFVSIQLESILNDIKEKVIQDLLNNQNYAEKLLLHTKNNEINIKALKNEETKKNEDIQNTAMSTSTTLSTATKNTKKKGKNLRSSYEFQKNTIKKPNLRKKICLKLAKILQNVYMLEKTSSQKLSLTIESKIRTEFPLMNLDYKSNIKTIFHILKSKKLSCDRVKEIFSLDFKHLSSLIKGVDIIEEKIVN